MLDQVGDGEVLAVDLHREIGLHARLGEHRQELAGVPLHAGADAGLQLAVGSVEELLAVADAVVAQVADGVDALVAGDQLGIDAVGDHRVHRAPGAASGDVFRAEVVVGQALAELGPRALPGARASSRSAISGSRAGTSARQFCFG